MPSYVVKCAPDRDEYVYWSDIVEAPHCIGTRSEVKQYVSYIGEGGADVEARFERADRNGTSALPGFYDWSDRGFIVEQRGWLPRALLAEFTHKFCANDDSCYDLLEPFEDDDLDEPAKASPTQTPGPSGGDPAPLSRQDGQTGSLPLRGKRDGPGGASGGQYDWCREHREAAADIPLDRQVALEAERRRDDALYSL